MSSPPELVTVICPTCGGEFTAWYRASINLTIESFSKSYLKRLNKARCPQCNTLVKLEALIVDADGTSRMPW